jgi:hypothetical protein
VMNCGGAMRIGKGARSAKRVLCDGEGASATQGRKQKGRGRHTLSVELKIHLAPLRFIDPWSHAPRVARAACINYKRTAQSLTGGTHHDQSGQAHACARSLRRGNRRAAAGRHVRVGGLPEKFGWIPEHA